MPDQTIFPVVANYHTERHDDTSGLPDRINRQFRLMPSTSFIWPDE